MNEPFLLNREMGCDAAEFVRWLPGATRNARIESKGSHFHRVHLPSGMVEITLEPRPPRRIALMTIPVLAVSFRFIGMDAAARRDFLTFFDHYTRRGGG